MAGENLLAALQDRMITGGDTYAGIGSNAIAQTIPALVDPYGSVGTNAGYVLGGSILSALLGRMARNDADEENAKTSLLQNKFLQAEPEQRVQMTQENPFMFSKLNTVLSAQDLAQQAQDKADTRKLEIAQPFDMAAENRNLENQIKLKTDPRLISADPEAKSKLFDDERTMTNDFTKHPVVADFKYKETTLKALTEAYKDPAGTSDFEMLRRTAQMVEPGLAVRQDDQDSLQQAASALGVSKSYIDSIVNGSSKNDPSVRAGMMRIAQRAYDSSLGNYNSLRSNFVDRSSGYGLNSRLTVPYEAGQDFKTLYPDMDISLGSASQPVTQQFEDPQKAAKIAFGAQFKAANPNSTAAEARAAWFAQGGK